MRTQFHVTLSHPSPAYSGDRIVSVETFEDGTCHASEPQLGVTRLFPSDSAGQKAAIESLATDNGATVTIRGITR
jgi:hypothetical protein